MASFWQRKHTLTLGAANFIHRIIFNEYRIQFIYKCRQTQFDGHFRMEKSLLSAPNYAKTSNERGRVNEEKTIFPNLKLHKNGANKSHHYMIKKISLGFFFRIFTSLTFCRFDFSF